ncbi:MAG: amino acid racemase [Parcubacteria group bacterium]|jgi:aspartate racemase
MKVDSEFTLGILGGMGPMAGVEFQKRIIEKMPARMDSDHIKMICFTNPKIKDRTESIKKGDDFSNEVVRSLNLMKKFGVSVGVITCNTAHASFEKITARTSFPLINIIEETALFVAKKYSFAGKIGLLATDGTIVSKIYHKALTSKGIEVITPIKNNQKELMNIIYGRSGIKSGCINSNRIKVLRIIRDLEEDGADVIILGCTELSLLGINGKDIVDPLDVVTDKIIGACI